MNVVIGKCVLLDALAIKVKCHALNFAVTDICNNVLTTVVENIEDTDE